MTAPVTMETVTADNRDLIGKLTQLLRTILGEIADKERAASKNSKRDRAISRWQVYLGVMLLKCVEAIEALMASRNVRAMAILVRSMYEYQQKAEYFLTHRKEAFEQFGSIGARQYSELSKLAHPDDSMGVRLVAAFLEWKRTSGSRHERSGDVAMSKMHLANAKKAAIKVDKSGTRYTEEFQTAYSIPSLYVHGEPLLMPEVFPKLNDDKNWEFREDVTNLDALSILGSAYSHLLRFCVKTTKAYGLEYGRIRLLMPQIERVINSTAELRGYDRRVVERVT
jgi:hypothetical protein